MTSEQWLAANPVTHKCTQFGGNIRPEQCERRKLLAKEKTIGMKNTGHAFSTGPDATEVLMSLRRCADCPGPEDLRTSTYQRLDGFRESYEDSKKPRSRRCTTCGELYMHAASRLCPSCRRKKTIREKKR